MTNQFLPIRKAEIGEGTIIRRALPQKGLRRIGAWCFLDHAGPVQFSDKGLDVAPHPHVGLQTFTWMLEGELLHRDSLGFEQLIKPKQVNLMTAGHGIAHSETTPDGVQVLHSAQLWIALPKQQKDVAPHFEHYPDLPEQQINGVNYIVLMGDYLGMSSPVPSYSPLVAVDIQTEQTQDLVLDLRPDFEYGVLLLAGQVTLDGQRLDVEQLFYCTAGATELRIQLQAGSRLLFLGGEPYTDELAVWWNFVCHDQAELEQAYADWLNHSERFGVVVGYEGDRLEAPVLSGQVRFS